MEILELQSTITEMIHSLDGFSSRLEMAVEWTWRHTNVAVCVWKYRVKMLRDPEIWAWDSSNIWVLKMLSTPPPNT